MSDAQPATAVARLLHPRSVAIVGISADARSIGGFVLDNLERFGFAGELHLVNPKGAVVRGRTCRRSIQELPPGIDVAVLAIPEAAVVEAIEACGSVGIAAAVVFAAGYAEVGAEGLLKQEALCAVAHKAGVALVGPNCMGLTNYQAGSPLTFETVDPYPAAGRPGISIVAQSGAMANNVREAMIGRGIPIVVSVSTGNEAVLTLEDFIEHFIDDAQTRVIAVYAEQIRQPARFRALACRARAAGKPLAVMMIGRSSRAREAAQSHTGALTGDYATARVVLGHASAIVPATLDEFFDVLPLLLRYPQPSPGGLAFVTGSGAMKNIALDLGQDLGLDYPAFADDTVRRLQALLPGYAVAENPLDYTTIAMRDPGAMATLIDAVVDDPQCGAVIVSQMGGSAMNQRDKAAYMVPAVARSPKPAALVIMGDGGPLRAELVDAAAASGVAFYRSPDRALRAMALMRTFAESLADARLDVVRPDLASVRRASDAFAAGGLVAEHLGKAWLASAGIPTPPGALARTADEAVQWAEAIGYPVVLKAQSAQLAHKSDAGGVVIDLRDASAVREAWARIERDVGRAKPGLVLDGMLVEAMARRGLELVVGARRDPHWGPVVMVGLGGIWIEALGDVRLLDPEASRERILQELQRLKAAAVLRGLRGQPAIDRAAVADVVATVGALMQDMPEIVEIDINPLVAYPDGVMALDALIVCDATTWDAPRSA